MLISLEPLPLHDFPCVRVDFLHPTVIRLSNVFVYIERKERTTLSSSLRLDQVVKRHALHTHDRRKTKKTTLKTSRKRRGRKAIVSCSVCTPQQHKKRT